MLFASVAISIYILTSSARGLPFFHTSPAFIVCTFAFYRFRFAHPYQYELDHFTPPDSVLQKPEPQVSADLSC